MNRWKFVRKKKKGIEGGREKERGREGGREREKESIRWFCSQVHNYVSLSGDPTEAPNQEKSLTSEGWEFLALSVQAPSGHHIVRKRR